MTQANSESNKKTKQIRTLSWKFEDGSLAETIYDSLKETTEFIVGKPND